MHDVAVLHHVVLALETQLPGLSALGFAAEPDEVVEGDDFRADEPALDVAVDAPGGLARGRPATDRPRATLVLARGEKAHEIEQGVARADEAIARALRQPEIREERLAIAGVELGHL